MRESRVKSTRLTVRGGASPSGTECAHGNVAPYGTTWSVSYRQTGVGDFSYREITGERLIEANADMPRGGWRRFSASGPKAVVVID